MEKILELAKDLGHEIQHDPRFIRTQMAQQAADEDKELQDMVKYKIERTKDNLITFSKEDYPP